MRRTNIVCSAPDFGNEAFTSSNQFLPADCRLYSFRRTTSLMWPAQVWCVFHSTSPLFPLRLSELSGKGELGFVQHPALIQDFSSDHILVILSKRCRHELRNSTTQKSAGLYKRPNSEVAALDTRSSLPDEDSGAPAVPSCSVASATLTPSSWLGESSSSFS